MRNVHMLITFLYFLSDLLFSYSSLTPICVSIKSKQEGLVIMFKICKTKCFKVCIPKIISKIQICIKQILFSSNLTGNCLTKAYRNKHRPVDI